MYNLTVDEAHTFFVGNGDWLVHNDCDFYLTGEFSKFESDPSSLSGKSLLTHINADPYSAAGLYDNNKLIQVGLYDANGDVIYHIDEPDTSTPNWHYHDFRADPGNPSIGHGTGKPHPEIGDWNALEKFLRDRGFNFDDWKSF